MARGQATARDHSISPAACNLANKIPSSRSHIPASRQSRNRRQAVIPQPNPSSAGGAPSRSRCGARTGSLQDQLRAGSLHRVRTSNRAGEEFDWRRGYMFLDLRALVDPLDGVDSARRGERVRRGGSRLYSSSSVLIQVASTERSRAGWRSCRRRLRRRRPRLPPTLFDRLADRAPALGRRPGRVGGPVERPGLGDEEAIRGRAPVEAGP